MTDDHKIENYLRKHAQWAGVLDTLRSVFRETELEETVKWGTPHYTYNGKLVAGLAGFKNHCAVWFHQGVFLEDSENKLINAQEGTTKALRQWRFEEGDSVNVDLVRDYVLEAISNAKAGKELTPERKKKLTLPPLLRQALTDNAKLNAAFLTLTPGKQREYAEYIATAKQDATKRRRLDKCIPLIEDGKGLNDKYKNS
ncbi:MAG: hypothetical protein CMC08_00960 [Flavobacteriaceae bacterium]|nr:hypothetical protein [Flavobacteriaceae bacterium]